jgi:hypothetical protein
MKVVLPKLTSNQSALGKAEMKLKGLRLSMFGSTDDGFLSPQGAHMDSEKDAIDIPPPVYRIHGQPSKTKTGSGNTKKNPVKKTAENSETNRDNSEEIYTKKLEDKREKKNRKLEESWEFLDIDPAIAYEEEFPPYWEDYMTNEGDMETVPKPWQGYFSKIVRSPNRKRRSSR